MVIKAIVRRGALALGLLSVLPSFAVAQELEEVVVSAQKREQNVQTVPVAIDVFNADALAESGISEIRDLKQISSSFSINTAGGNGQLFLRGVGSNVQGNGTYGSVAVYIDGVYIPQGYSIAAGVSNLQNLESIQVLKGPQGTLYGRNATGGALVVTTKTPHPGEELGGTAKVGFGNFGLKQASASIYGGFNDKFAGLFAVDYHKNDGYIKNLGGTNTGDFDSQDGYSIHGKLVFKPTENSELTLGWVHNDDKQATLAFQQIGQTDVGIPMGGLGFPGSPELSGPQAVYFGALVGQPGAPGLLTSIIAGGILAANPMFTPPQAFALAFPQAFGIGLPAALGLRFSNQHAAAYSNQISGFKNGYLTGKHISKEQGAGGWYGDDFFSFKANVGFENFDLVATTTYNPHRDETSAEVFRVDPTSTFKFSTLSPTLASFNTPNLGFSGIFDNKAFSQELYAVSKKSDIEWIGGVYYFHQVDDSVLTGEFFGTSGYFADNKLTNQSVAGFAEATFPFRDHWKLTTGVRYTREKASLDDRIVNNNPRNQTPCTNIPATPTARATQSGTCNVETIPFAAPPNRSDNAATYNLKLAYQGDKWLAYAGASSGFKSGGLNSNNPVAGQVGPEKIKSVEIGFKSEIADGRVRFNGSAFNYKYDNIQLNVLEVSSGSTFLVDGVKADVNGLELDVQAGLTDRFSVFGSTTLLDTKYKNNAVITPLVGAPFTQVIKGNKLAQAPNAVIIAGVDYKIPGIAEGELALNISANYNSGYWINQANTYGSGGDGKDSFTTANVALKYTTASKKFSASLWGNNVSNAKYFAGGIDAAGGFLQLVTAGHPRSFGVTAEYKF